MKRRKVIAEPIMEPEQLKQISGWEVRQIHAGKHPAITLQNPSTGERIHLAISRECFRNNWIKILRKEKLEYGKN